MLYYIGSNERMVIFYGRPENLLHACPIWADFGIFLFVILAFDKEIGQNWDLRYKSRTVFLFHPRGHLGTGGEYEVHALFLYEVNSLPLPA